MWSNQDILKAFKKIGKPNTLLFLRLLSSARRSGKFTNANFMKLLENPSALAMAEIEIIVNFANDMGEKTYRTITADAVSKILKGRILPDYSSWSVANRPRFISSSTAEASRENRGRLIREMADEQRAKYAELVLLNGSENPILGTKGKENINRLVDTYKLGLTVHQMKFVNDMGEKFDKIRDGKISKQTLKRIDAVDKALARKIRSGKLPTKRDITSLKKKFYRSRLEMRAKTIARTEQLRNANKATHNTFREAIREGVLEPSKLVKIWIARVDNRSRIGHSEINKQTVRYGEKFILPSGYRMLIPHASGAPASEVINCRCTYAIRYKRDTDNVIN